MLNFSLETARNVAERHADPVATYVIESLVSEVEDSHKREARLEEDVLDLQLRLSVLLAEGKAARGPEITVVYKDEMAEREKVLDEAFEYALHRDRITDGLIDTKGVEKDGLITDGTV